MITPTWGTPLGSALALSPILNVYDETEEAIKAQFDKYGTTAEYTPVYDPRNGKLFSIPGEFGEMSNPIAKLSLPGDKHWSHKFVANFCRIAIMGQPEIQDFLWCRPLFLGIRWLQTSLLSAKR